MQLKREGGWWFRQVFKIDPEKMKMENISNTGAGGIVRRAVTGGIKTRLGEGRKIKG